MKNRIKHEGRIAIWVFAAICIVMTFVFLVRLFLGLEVWFIFPRLIMYLIFYVPLTIVIVLSSYKIIKYPLIGLLIFLFMATFTPSLISPFIPLDHPCEFEENQNDPECLEYDD